MRRLGAAAASLGAIWLVAAPSQAQVPPAAPDKMALGDWQLAPLVEVRTRGEYRHAPVDVGGAASGGLVNDSYAALERTRLGLGAEHGALRAQVTLQDAHAWGALPPTATVPSAATQGEVGAYEAFLEVRTSSARPSFLRVGRQAVTWGEGRLVSAADWSPTGRSLDAIRGRYARGTWDFELLGALLEAQRPLGTQFGDTAGPQTGGSELFGGQVAWTIDPLLKLELFALGRLTQHGAAQPPVASPRFAQSLASGETYVGSLRVSGDGRGFRYGAEGAYELGRATSVSTCAASLLPTGTPPPGCSGVGETRAAFAVAAHVSYTFDTLVLTPTLRLAGSYASGDDGSSSKYKQFDPLLPDVHAWHGAMDLFAWSNEIEASARITIVPWTDGTIAAEYRFAQLAQASGDWVNAYLGVVGNAPASSATTLGHEIDGFVTWRPWPVLGLVAGYSALVLGDGARAILANPAVGRGSLQPDGTFKPTDVSHLAYLQATLTVP